jgi:hypothetical protein
MDVDWARLVIGQLEFYWDVHLRPRLDGLTDEEYLWQPVPDCWTVRPGPDGGHVLDGQWPEPTPPPVTTIAWRMLHIGVGCLAERSELFFGGPAVDTTHLPATAAGALSLLDDAYRRWHDAIAALDPAGLATPLGLGKRHDVFAEEPMAALIVHINREVMHHGGEIGVLRDLYRASFRR